MPLTHQSETFAALTKSHQNMCPPVRATTKNTCDRHDFFSSYDSSRDSLTTRKRQDIGHAVDSLQQVRPQTNLMPHLPNLRMPIAMHTRLRLLNTSDYHAMLVRRQREQIHRQRAAIIRQTFAASACAVQGTTRPAESDIVRRQRRWIEIIHTILFVTPHVQVALLRKKHHLRRLMAPVVRRARQNIHRRKRAKAMLDLCRKEMKLPTAKELSEAVPFFSDWPLASLESVITELTPGVVVAGGLLHSAVQQKSYFGILDSGVLKAHRVGPSTSDSRFASKLPLGARRALLLSSSNEAEESSARSDSVRMLSTRLSSIGDLAFFREPEEKISCLVFEAVSSRVFVWEIHEKDLIPIAKSVWAAAGGGILFNKVQRSVRVKWMPLTDPPEKLMISGLCNSLPVGWNDRLLLELESLLTPQTFPAAHVFHRPGDPARSLFFISYGSVELYWPGATGQDRKESSMMTNEKEPINNRATNMRQNAEKTAIERKENGELFGSDVTTNIQRQNDKLTTESISLQA